MCIDHIMECISLCGMYINSLFMYFVSQLSIHGEMKLMKTSSQTCKCELCIVAISESASLQMTMELHIGVTIYMQLCEWDYSKDIARHTRPN